MRELTLYGAMLNEGKSREFNRELRALVGITSIGITCLFNELTARCTGAYAQAVRKVYSMLVGSEL